MLPSKKIEDFASGCLDALLAKYDESSKAKMHQGPLMPSLPSMFANYFVISSACSESIKKIFNALLANGKK